MPPTLQSARNSGGGVVTRRSLAFSLALVALGTIAPFSGARAANPAEAFVRTSIDKSYAILNRDDPDREAEFRALLLSIVDAKRVALFALGPYARDASQADTEMFVAAFTNLLAAVYQRGLETYKGRSLEVTGSTERSLGDVVVNVVVAGREQTAPKFHLDFRVRRQPDGTNVITDLQVEGVWLALTQREEFSAYLKQHHGSVAELSAQVDRKADQLHSASKTASTSP